MDSSDKSVSPNLDLSSRLYGLSQIKPGHKYDFTTKTSLLDNSWTVGWVNWSIRVIHGQTRKSIGKELAEIDQMISKEVTSEHNLSYLPSLIDSAIEGLRNLVGTYIQDQGIVTVLKEYIISFQNHALTIRNIIDYPERKYLFTDPILSKFSLDHDSLISQENPHTEDRNNPEEEALSSDNDWREYPEDSPYHRRSTSSSEDQQKDLKQGVITPKKDGPNEYLMANSPQIVPETTLDSDLEPMIKPESESELGLDPKPEPELEPELEPEVEEGSTESLEESYPPLTFPRMNYLADSQGKLTQSALTFLLRESFPVIAPVPSSIPSNPSTPSDPSTSSIPSNPSIQTTEESSRSDQPSSELNPSSDQPSDDDRTIYDPELHPIPEKSPPMPIYNQPIVCVPITPDPAPALAPAPAHNPNPAPAHNPNPNPVQKIRKSKDRSTSKKSMALREESRGSRRKITDVNYPPPNLIVDWSETKKSKKSKKHKKSKKRSKESAHPPDLIDDLAKGIGRFVQTFLS